jgi:hypothetical protein
MIDLRFLEYFIRILFNAQNFDSVNRTLLPCMNFLSHCKMAAIAWNVKSFGKVNTSDHFGGNANIHKKAMEWGVSLFKRVTEFWLSFLCSLHG